MATRLDVIIPTVGRTDLLRATLTSLAACRKPKIYYQTIVIANGPKAGAEEVVKDFHASLNVLYIYSPVKNKSHALNIGLSEIQDSLIFFMDDDVRIYRLRLSVIPIDVFSWEGQSFNLIHVSVVFAINVPRSKPLFKTDCETMRNCPLVEVVLQ